MKFLKCKDSERMHVQEEAWIYKLERATSLAGAET